MYFNVTEILETVNDQSNLIGIIVGSGIFGSVLTLVLRHFDTKSKKKATLYYPLFLACTAIIEAVTEHEKLGIDYSKKQLISSSKTLDQIIYNHGSLIYLEGTDLEELLKMKATIDRNIQFFEEEISWNDFKKLLKNDGFYKINASATHLLNMSKNNVKALRKTKV